MKNLVPLLVLSISLSASAQQYGLKHNGAEIDGKLFKRLKINDLYCNKEERRLT